MDEGAPSEIVLTGREGPGEQHGKFETGHRTRKSQSTTVRGAPAGLGVRRPIECARAHGARMFRRSLCDRGGLDDGGCQPRRNLRARAYGVPQLLQLLAMA